MYRSPLMIYLPTDVKKVLEEKAKRQKKKMSAFVLELLCKEFKLEKVPERYVEKEEKE